PDLLVRVLNQLNFDFVPHVWSSEPMAPKVSRSPETIYPTVLQNVLASIGKSLLFESASSDYLSGGPSTIEAATMSQQKFTISLWFKLTSTGQMIFLDLGQNNASNHIAFFLTGANHLQFLAETAGLDII